MKQSYSDKNKFKTRLLGVCIIVVVLLAIICVYFSRMGLSNAEVQFAQLKGLEQTVSINVKLKEYTPIVVQKGIPVKFILNARDEDLNGCNSTVVIPEFDIKMTLKPGENIINFIPGEKGKITYACSMGMIKSYIKVVEDITKK